MRKGIKISVLLITIFLVVISCSKKEESEEPINPIANSGSNNGNTGGTGGTTNNPSKAKAIADYKNYYLPSSTSRFVFNGSVSSCKEGSLDAAFLQKVLKRINYFRRVAGLPDNIVFIDSLSAKSQKAAYICKLNKAINHNPPSTWTCYSEAASIGCSKSNLTYWLGTDRAGATTINDFIEDGGANNIDAKHRRWVLAARAKKMGYGCTDVSAALWVINDDDLSRSLPTGIPEFIAWPPKGYVPNSLVFPRWSFAVPVEKYPYNVDFSTATITMKNATGSAIPLTIISRSSGAGSSGDNTIVWEPTGIDNTNTTDVVYTVTVENVIVGGVAKNYSYDVTLFKP